MPSCSRPQTLLILTCAVLLLALPAAAQNSCTVGNTNDPLGPPATGIFMGNETYAFEVFPPSQCSCNEGGFLPLNVSQWLSFDANQVPANFTVRAQLLAAVPDPAGNGCFRPGGILCAGLPVQLTVSAPGPFLATAAFDTCAIQNFNAHYFLALEYTGNAPGSLLTDGQPQECIEYLNDGTGWKDMFFFPGKTGGGKSIIFGDIVCGAYAVDTEQNTWGTIKSLYR